MEIVTVVVLIIILTGAMLPALDRQLSKSIVNMEAEKLVSELRLAQQMALTRRDGYQYYGLKIYPNLGGYTGYKILRYTLNGAGSLIEDPQIVKSPVASDNPLIFDQNLIINERISLGNYSTGNNNQIIFTPQGSATCDGKTPLQAQAGYNYFILYYGNVLNQGNKRYITISPITGHVEITIQ